MKKTIYFGKAKDFWWPTRFRDFFDNAKNIENILPEQWGGKILKKPEPPFIYYDLNHNVTILYDTEQTFYPEQYTLHTGSPGLLRAKVILYGKEERDIENLEWLVKKEAKKYEGVDDVPPKRKIS
ncbi:hypothetical protein J4456_03775 [Candidatus Pacearchaeota archaeon]|nr:hypothetical protein [Candidatus Pacearchaeota archaeon]